MREQSITLDPIDKWNRGGQKTGWSVNIGRVYSYVLSTQLPDNVYAIGWILQEHPTEANTKIEDRSGAKHIYTDDKQDNECCQIALGIKRYHCNLCQNPDFQIGIGDPSPLERVRFVDCASIISSCKPWDSLDNSVTSADFRTFKQLISCIC